jgi:hypothetical protein
MICFSNICCNQVAAAESGYMIRSHKRIARDEIIIFPKTIILKNNQDYCDFNNPVTLYMSELLTKFCNLKRPDHTLPVAMGIFRIHEPVLRYSHMFRLIHRLKPNGLTEK